MKREYSSPIIFGFLTAESLGFANRYMGSDSCCNCTAAGNSRT